MFTPPFCPYKACDYHTSPPRDVWWRRFGHHVTKCFGRVPRFQCHSCKRTFSTQTFSIDYYAKRKIDYRRLESPGASSVSVRALGRNLRCSPGSVLNRLDRLARQSIACHAELKPRARRIQFRDRAFLSLLRLDGMEDRVWRKSTMTPGAGQRSYLPRFALA